METNKISANIANGTVHYTDHLEKISDSEWKEHHEFKGVYLKNIIKGKNTDGLFSSHMVKIDPGCCLKSHCHENQLELHEVIQGKGTCQLIEEKFDYHMGKMAVIPKGKFHMVKADKNGLTLLAKFFPGMS